MTSHKKALNEPIGQLTMGDKKGDRRKYDRFETAAPTSLQDTSADGGAVQEIDAPLRLDFA